MLNLYNFICQLYFDKAGGGGSWLVCGGSQKGIYPLKSVRWSGLLQDVAFVIKEGSTLLQNTKIRH